MAKRIKARADAPLSKDALVSYFEEGCRKPQDFRIGTEHEKFGFHLESKNPLPYDGERGIRAILTALAKKEPRAQPIIEDDHIIGLRYPNEGGNITLEPAGQLELSGAQCVSVHETEAELRDHLDNVRAISEALGVGFLSIAFPPHWRRLDMSPMPKARYAIMSNYMPQKGGRGLDMMYRTCTAQVNLDYSSEEDMVRKLRVSLALQPIVTALFANSPFREGQVSSYLSCRAFSWLDTDPDRTGMIPFAFEKGFGFERYAEYALDVPIYYIEREGRTINLAGESFRRFMEGKLETLPGERPTLADWELHLMSLFPEARLKRFMEMRGADVGTPERICALSAFWTGLFYDEDALAAASDLIHDWSVGERDFLWRDACRDGLGVSFRGKPLQEIALLSLNIAAKGLAKRAIKNAEGADESVFLKPLFEIAESGITPAQRLITRFHNEWKGDPLRLFDDPECRFV